MSIVGIAVLHVVTGSLDNFIENVIRGEGYKHQVNISDIYYVTVQVKFFLSCNGWKIRDLK